MSIRSGLVFLLLMFSRIIICAQIEIRPGRIDELPAILEFDKRTSIEAFKPIWLTGYSHLPIGQNPDYYLDQDLINDAHFFPAIIENQVQDRFLIAHDAVKDRPAGIIVFHKESDEGLIIDLLMVDQSYRRQGIAKNLITQALNTFPEIAYCDVSPLRFANDTALAFYESMGFKRLGLAPADKIIYGASYAEMFYHYRLDLKPKKESPVLTRLLELDRKSGSKKAIVLGASTGIGRELAKELSKNGYEIGLCSRKIELLKTLQKELRTKTWVQQIDLMQVGTLHKKLAELAGQMGGLDLMIINSGIVPEVHDQSLAELDAIAQTIQVNVMGCAAACNFAANYFLKQNYGHIVGITSIDALRGNAYAPAYSASKAFFSTFLEGLRNKFSQAAMPIFVTEIRPGAICKTDKIVGESGRYWEVTAQIAAQDIYESIKHKEKVAYVPRRWRLIAWLLAVTPDWLYNRIGGF